MIFGKGFLSKLDKAFSPFGDPESLDDPPPPYLPEEFTSAGIKEDDLQILKDYDTVIVLDDSGSMRDLWAEVGLLSSPLLVRFNINSRRLLL